MNVLFVSVTGHSERSGWSAILVEPEGFFEEYQGVASSLERAFLWALSKTIGGISDNEQLAIRSCDRAVLRWEHILSDGDSHQELEEHTDLLNDIQAKLSRLELKWFDASRYKEAGDSRAQALAHEALMSHHFNFETKEIEFVTQMLYSDRASASESHSAAASEQKDTLDNASTPQPEPSQPEPKVEHIPNTPSSDPVIAVEESKILHKNDVAEDSLNPISKPEESLSIPVASEYLFGARILAYIDGVGMSSLGAWSFVLVDRQTGNALLRAEGIRSTTPYRMRITAAIEALLSLKEKDQRIEIRSRYRNIILLGQNWMHTWKANEWTKKNKDPIKDLPFVQQLFELSQEHRVSWCHITEHSDEQGIQDAIKLSKEALRRLNYGESSEVNTRNNNYPVSHLI